jgi:hypothetical protein
MKKIDPIAHQVAKKAAAHNAAVEKILDALEVTEKARCALDPLARSPSGGRHLYFTETNVARHARMS